MAGLDPVAVKRWKAGMEAANLLDLEERRNASYRVRFRQLTMIWRQAQRLGTRAPSPVDLQINDRWQKLRKAYADRHV